ncbi:GPP34 family phosphoprotein [uncultured Pseudokineococcus sp.]|uniref:GOLPH3/VPS74 family protein n=1 Tax=uncultured Pseudokineococcus sp. TaxID=1642928 RepID=UPI0026355198|nr:GPP34 family phosphoprotein [uncultured Pseudokineococcus sp.]
MAERAPVEDVEHELTLPEELLLLVYDDEKGTTWSTSLDTGLGGAVQLDLSLRSRVDVVDGDLVVVDATPTGEPVLDGALAEVAATSRPRPPKRWLGPLGREVRAAALERLVERGVLHREDDRVLWVLPHTRYPEADGGPEDRVRGRLHDAVVVGTTPDARTAALASLVKALGLRREVFPEADRRATDRRLEQLAEGEWAGAAVKRSLDEVVMTAVMVSTLAATSTATTS